MEPYAVIETGGKQYRVEKGSVIEVERLTVEAGGKVEIPAVLAASDGKELMIGTPHIKGAKVMGEVVAQFRGPKVVAFKKKRRKGYKKKIGHRQELTRVRIVECIL